MASVLVPGERTAGPGGVAVCVDETADGVAAKESWSADQDVVTRPLTDGRSLRIAKLRLAPVDVVVRLAERSQSADAPPGRRARESCSPRPARSEALLWCWRWLRSSQACLPACTWAAGVTSAAQNGGAHHRAARRGETHLGSRFCRSRQDSSSPESPEAGVLLGAFTSDEARAPASSASRCPSTSLLLRTRWLLLQPGAVLSVANGNYRVRDGAGSRSLNCPPVGGAGSFVVEVIFSGRTVSV
jgi:hypothetical protein